MLGNFLDLCSQTFVSMNVMQGTISIPQSGWLKARSCMTTVLEKMKRLNQGSVTPDLQTILDNIEQVNKHVFSSNVTKSIASNADKNERLIEDKVEHLTNDDFSTIMNEIKEETQVTKSKQVKSSLHLENFFLRCVICVNKNRNVLFGLDRFFIHTDTCQNQYQFNHKRFNSTIL